MNKFVMTQKQQKSTNEGEQSNSFLDLSLDQEIKDRNQLHTEIEKSISEIKTEVQLHQKVLKELASAFKGEPLFQTVSFFGKKITIVLEKDQSGSLTNSEFINFENLNKRGEQINIYSWLKQQKQQ